MFSMLRKCRAGAPGQEIFFALFRQSCAAIIAIFFIAGCSGGMHHKGQHQIGVSGSFGHAIKGETPWHDGDGRADNAGVAVDYHYFLEDRLAIGGAITPYRNYNLAGRDSATGEFQLGVRYYIFEFDVLEKPVGLFAEVSGGILHGSRSVPEEGSHTNFTQDNTLGLEWKLSDNISWQTGYRFRHLSNGYIFDSVNPAQNDHQVFTGFAISWN
ncbi:MAG: acyloxyacyl hydrolase [Planctomycetes bacterium]|nr:acyloxyacyl hydrolase [Planctomycetota bacterium]